MTTQRVKYLLGSAGNYRYNIVKMGYHEYDHLAYIHKADFPDVEVTRPSTDTDFRQIHQTCLMTVNGYLHPTEYVSGKLYIPGATHSMLRSGGNATGLLDFGAITPALKRHTITPSMVTQDTNVGAYDKVFITFDVPIQQPILILAGYLITYDPGTFYRISDNTFALCLSKLQYMEKLYELNRYRDIFKHLDVPVSPLNAQMVDTETVRSLAVIRRLLSLNNSLLIDLEVDNFSLHKTYMDSSKIPGTFTTQTRPDRPIVVGYGKLAEYAVRRDNEYRYSVFTQDCHYNNHLFSRMNQSKIKAYNDSRAPGMTHNLVEAFFLDMTTDR